ncbi:methyl-accepting chemotaxis protein [Aporhodopirellula aestuarii]|uniref:Methyl-accepting chemotaxis protein n=1 Tax=Aporhodopirellula aestuarii TaxID=2950107 RepID=A0ABT0UC76_9BACT|nr:methyl-accepting chemotaxis protein [Aporhodopirellula aestuarii]MCM2374417.1 methyl-accepting chemotaxis protein [Aporhodopirellula aestuarii]
MMRNRGVSLKLIALVTVSVIAFCVMGIFGVSTTRDTFESVREVRQTAVEFRKSTLEITEPLNQLRQLSLKMVMSPDQRMRIELNDLQQQKTREIDGVLASWDTANADMDELAAFNALRTSWARYKTIKDVTVAKVLKYYREEAFINAIQAENEQFEDVKDHLNNWMAAKQQDADEAYDAAETRYSNSIRLYLIVIVALTLLVGTIGYLTATTIIGPIEKMRRVATKIADHASTGSLGLLDERIELKSNDELGALATAFNQMVENMQISLKRLSEEEKRTQAILNSAADGILTVDSDGRVRSINAAAERLFACSADKAIGSDVVEFLPAYSLNGTLGNTTEHGGKLSAGGESEVHVHTRDGRQQPIALRISEMSYGGETLTIATLQDITARKADEEERRTLFRAIRNAVQRLAVASRQILASTSEQSVGTQIQAASIAQTVSTVNEISQTAQQAAQRSSEVADSARQADDVGNEGRSAIEESIHAMEQVQIQVESLATSILSLAERAQAIGEITATVKEIAEQTNVLALNAAVEASRAGEHGKGFAVVASEVKSLAQQSKNATNQVRTILTEIQQATQEAVLSTENGNKAVASASHIVGKAGDTINQLVATLAVSAKLAAQISASASQQAIGVSQLKDGMTDINGVTQRQAETIKQIEHSAQNLNELSNELADLTA